MYSTEVSGTTVIVSLWELKRRLFPQISHNKNCQGGTSKETGYGAFPAFLLHTGTPRLDMRAENSLGRGPKDRQHL